MTVDLKALGLSDLLALHGAIGEELRTREVVRSANNPVGDLAEYLFCKAFGWTQAPNSAKEYDATDDAGRRVQIKGRRVHRRNRSRQVSALRGLEDEPFDLLAGVIFGEDYEIVRAVIVPHAVVLAASTYRRHTNAHTFMLRDAVWDDPNAEDVTSDLADILRGQGSMRHG